MRLRNVAVLAVWLAAAPHAWAQQQQPAASDGGLPAPAGAAEIARQVAASPRRAEQIVGVAVARDPSEAGAIAAAAVAAAPGAAAAIVKGATQAASGSAADIAAQASAAAATAAGHAASRRGTPAQAAQASLNAAAVASANVTAAVILAAAGSPDARMTGDTAAAITRAAVTAAMGATQQAAMDAASAAGATPDLAQRLGNEAAARAASTITQSAIAAATTAVRMAAETDASQAAAQAAASPQAAADLAAASASKVANSVTASAVEASARAMPQSAAQVSEAAARAASKATSEAAGSAASAAGANPQDTDRIAAAAGTMGAEGAGEAASSAVLAAVPNAGSGDAAAASGAAMVGGVAGLRAAGSAVNRVDGGTGLVAPQGGGGAAAKVQQEAIANQLAAPPAPAAPAPRRFSFSSGLGNPGTIIPGVLGVLAFLTVIGLAAPWLETDIFATRLKVITEKRGELSQQRKQRLEKERPSLRLAMQSGRVNFMRAVLTRLNLSKITEQPELKKKLLRAGKRSPQALVTFTFLRLALPIGLGGFAALLLFGSSNFHMAAIFKLMICMGGVLFGYLLPDIMVSNAVAKRQQEIQKKFPDALDLMVICIESGISLEAAFTRVAEEMAADAPALSEEVALTTAELSFLSDRRQALDNFADRAGTPSVKSLVTSLIQSEKYGTPLGAAIRVVSQEGRESRMAKAEEKAAALPAKLTVPMVLFFLPVLFLVLIGPTIIQVMAAFSHK